MSPQEEALRQISQIKDHLIDKQHFYPYNYNAMFVWSVIAVLLTIFMAPLYESQGIMVGTVVTFVLMAIGFIAEGVMTKQVNKNYDIEECTKRQRFVMKNFIMITLFLIVLSMTLASYKLYIPIYLSWLFLISLGYFAVGYALNIDRFTKIGQFNIYLSVILLVVGWYREHLVGMDSICFRIVQVLVIFGLAILPSYVAWYQKRELKRV
jgi:hypothetical protein